jgi:hypothetical protein
MILKESLKTSRAKHPLNKLTQQHYK